jgi:hypothetical protein
MLFSSKFGFAFLSVIIFQNVPNFNIFYQIERRRIDAEEEDYQQDIRQNQLDKANKQFHDNQDMVKALHSKMLMCDVASEQEQQRQLAAKKKALHKEIDL